MASKERQFWIKPFSSVVLQEDWYRDNVRSDICVYRDLPVTDRKAGVVIRQVDGVVDIGDEHLDNPYFEVRMFSYKKSSETARKIAVAECRDRFNAEHVEEQVQLKCGAESFFVCVDGWEEEFDAVGGFGGRVSVYEDMDVFYLEFNIAAYMTTWEQFEATIELLFQVEDEESIVW